MGRQKNRPMVFTTRVVACLRTLSKHPLPYKLGVKGMSLCEDDAAQVGPVSLFLGIETAKWSLQQFLDAAHFAVQHGVTTLFIKVFEVQTKDSDNDGMFYGGFSAWDSLYNEIQKVVNVVPYGFIYGDTTDGSIATEINTSKYLLNKYKKLCLDMEGQPWTTADAGDRAKQFSDVLTPINGKLWLSVPADPYVNNMGPFLVAMSPATNVYMPMVYSDSLNRIWDDDYNKQLRNGLCIQPTVDLSGEFGANNVPDILAYFKTKGILAVSVWEYQFATSNPSLLDNVVSVYGTQKGETVGLNLNSHKEVGNFPNATQFVGGHDEFACGPFAVSHVKFASAPNVTDLHTQAEIQQWAFKEYASVIGPDTPSSTAGSSIANMDTFYHDAGLHYWEMAIDANSSHGDDINRIKAALNAGYPVIATVEEASVYDIALNSNPYFWGPSGNHVLVFSGIAQSGNLLSEDTANVTGALQGNNWAQPGPREYDINKLVVIYGCIVQTSWLKAIPSGDPLTWQAGFNAQNIGGSSVTPTPTTGTAFNINETIVKLWELITPELPRNTGFFNAWRTEYIKGNYHGSPQGPEVKDVDSDGAEVIYMASNKGTWEWKNGSVKTWNK